MWKRGLITTPWMPVKGDDFPFSLVADLVKVTSSLCPHVERVVNRQT